MLKKIFSKLKKYQQKEEKIDFVKFHKKYLSVSFLDDNINKKVLYCIARDNKYIYITKEQLQRLEAMLEKKNKEEKVLQLTAELNNKGIAEEKKGNINSAIKFYEENIKIGGAATHSYERLMILYRKQKKYDNEISIIKIAIKTFSKENKRLYLNKLSKTKNKEEQEKIKEGFEKQKIIIGENGWIIFNPYSIKKYEDRLEKTVALKNKLLKE